MHFTVSYRLTLRSLLPLLFLSFSFNGIAQVPTVQDCLGAIPVCQNTYNQPLSYQGTGNYPNEINPNQTCPQSCMDGEKNSVWYVISVQESGLLRFVITPVSPADDYDWAVYNITTMECSQIYNSAAFMQSSCNAAGGPGYQGATGISSANGGTKNCNNGGNTNKWNSDLPVNAGDTYVLCVSNWTQTQSGYLLDFSASTANIFDDVPPTIASVNTQIGCAGATEIDFMFSENVSCFSISPADFKLIGPDGTVHNATTVNGVGCEAGGEQEKFFTLGFYPPMYENGEYELKLTGDIVDLCGNNSQPHSKFFTVTLDPLPTITSGPADASVPVGGDASFTVEAIGDTSYRWQFRPNSGTFWQPLNEAPPYSGTRTPTLHISPATFELGMYQFRCIVSGECIPPTQSAAATLFVGDQLAASAQASPDHICYGSSSTLDVNAFGGNVQQPYTYLWSGPNGWTSTQKNPVVTPTETTTYTVEVNDGFNPATAQVTVVVMPLPLANAGRDTTISYGTFTSLHGSATIGSPPFTYQWQPADSLWNPNVQNPNTRKLRGSTLFSLVVTDDNGCISQADQVTVSVSGGPLALSPVASPSTICIGDSAVLSALGSGGNIATYQYIWKVNGEEISTEPEIVVSPQSTTTYTILLDDTFNQTERQITVNVNPLPVVNLLKPEYILENGIIQLCVYDTLMLDAGNTGAAYLWQDGGTQQYHMALTSGITFDLQEFSVQVTDATTGCINHDTVMVMFTFTACSYGLEEVLPQDLMKIFPNPAQHSVTVSLDGPTDIYKVVLTDLSGRTVFERKINKNVTGILNTTIDLTPFQKGTYLVKITASKGILVKKLIIN
ncbi:MAG: T9SS type A sorting domain-containing protein [Lentimicrobiaceae bacterium]|nr:T9SS type A sorting domain-containing protein [Lentimicrobiaceae bacterium]